MSHLVAIGGGWSLWSWACLRAAGFPAQLVTELASPELAVKADRVLALEAEAAQRRQVLVAACKSA
ncbi:MAG: hypothetical protein IAG13_34945, partial [Deltaproteobacteria bacterium]|nr:hypothetical protein [Nannocystaceae bacterium]